MLSEVVDKHQRTYGTAQAQHRTHSHELNYVQQSNLLKSGRGTHFNHDSSHLQP